MGPCGPDFSCKRRMRTGRRPVTASWHNVEMFAAPTSGCRRLSALFYKWWLRYKCRGSWLLRRRPFWCISIITLSPTRTFVRTFGGSQFTSQPFLILALSWRAHRTILVLARPPIWGFVVELSLSRFSFSVAESTFMSRWRWSFPEITRCFVVKLDLCASRFSRLSRNRLVRLRLF